MKKLSSRQKRWNEAKSKKALRLLTKYHKAFAKTKRGKNNGQKQHLHSTPSKEKKALQRIHTLNMPQNFSLTENSEETIKFFKKVLETIKMCHKKDYLNFNMSGIRNITPDALIYLLALIKNLKILPIKNINCCGNLPTDAKAQEIVEKSGFFNYVEAEYKKTVKIDSKEQIQITAGSMSDSETAGKVCDFVHQNCQSDIIHTKSLFPIIIELMTNTQQHAYKHDGKMKNQWFIFVENFEDKIRFVFLDTGKGIPSTIRKDFTEVITGWATSGSDGKYIASALEGDFRTETKEGHRGKGLPEIYNHCKCGEISDFIIFSNQGACKVDNNGKIETYAIENLEGTLFSWSIDKKRRVV